MDDLGKKLLRGDEAAWQHLYSSISPGLYRFIIGRVGSPEVAQDIMQEGFIRLSQNLRNIKKSSAYKTWLYSTCYRLAIDHHRSAQHRENLEQNLRYLDKEETTDPLVGILEQENHRSMRQALMNLSDSHRDVVTMRIWGELSYKEIAEITGVSEGTLRSQYHWAIRKLRQVFSVMNDVIKGVK